MLTFIAVGQPVGRSTILSKNCHREIFTIRYIICFIVNYFDSILVFKYQFKIPFAAVDSDPSLSHDNWVNVRSISDQRPLARQHF